MYISWFFTKVSAPDVHAYFRERIQRSHTAVAQACGDANLLLEPDIAEKYAANLVKSLPERTAAPMGPPVDFDTQSGNPGAIRYKHNNDIIQEIDTQFPGLDGEVTEKNDVSYLTADYLGNPAGTIILRRTTNLAIIFYIFPQIRWNVLLQKLEETGFRPDGLDSSEMVLETAALGIDFGDAAKSLAEGLTGLAPAPFNIIGSLLLKILWPSSGDAEKTWEKVYANLQTIVRNGFRDERITKASIHITGVINFLNSTYINAKMNAIEIKDGKKWISPKNKEKLFAMLPLYDHTLHTEVMNVLMFEDKNNHDQEAAALANFMLAANVHLSINQEFALVDSYDDPTKSAFAQTIKDLAKKYAIHAREIAPRVKELRLAQISRVKIESTTFDSQQVVVTIKNVWFEDSNTGFKSKDYSANEAGAENERQRHYDNISSEMDQMLEKQVYAVLKQWQKLETAPLKNWENSLDLRKF